MNCLNKCAAGRTSKEYYEANRDHIAQHHKQHRNEHKDQIAQQQKQYRKEHKDQIGQKNKHWYTENKDQIAHHRRHYYELNKDQILLRQKEYKSQKIQCPLCNSVVCRDYLTRHQTYPNVSKPNKQQTYNTRFIYLFSNKLN